MSRPLPDDLAEMLRRARALEMSAATSAQKRDAVHATTELAAAARRAGWTVEEIAAGLELHSHTLSRRLQRHIDHKAIIGLAVAAAPPAHVAAPLPLERREWLTWSEATTLSGASRSAIERWEKAGLLPTTLGVQHGTRRYSRTDLERVLDASERDRRGVRWAQLRKRLMDAQ